MESRRIAGFIFAVAAVAVPLIVSAMNLTIPQPIGFAGLAICLALLCLGLALAFAPQPKSLAEVEAERRQRVQDDLGRFMLTGNHLRQTITQNENEQPTEDVERWYGELHAYLMEHLGIAYSARARDATVIPPRYAGSLNGERLRLDGVLHVSLFHLDRFLRELA